MNTPEPFNDLSWNDDPLHSPNRTEYIEKLRARVKYLESICNEVSKEYPLQKYLEEKLGTKGEHSHFETIDNTASKLNTLRVRVKELEGERDRTQGNVCSFCNWANVGTLNIGDPNETSVWICHGCVKRQYAKLTALEKEVSRLKNYLERAGWGECNIPACNCNGWHKLRESRDERDQHERHREELTELTKERDKLQGELLASSLLLSQRTAERDQLKGEVADARWLLENIWMDMRGHNSVVIYRRRDAWLAKNPTPHDAK